MSREKVALSPRKQFTVKQRLEVLLAGNGKCAICKAKIVGEFEVEHRVPLALGGTNATSNLEPVHPEPCHRLKTAKDQAAIAKAKRLSGETCAGPTKRPLRSRGFDKSLSKRMDGSVVRRAPKTSAMLSLAALLAPAHYEDEAQPE